VCPFLSTDVTESSQKILSSAEKEKARQSPFWRIALLLILAVIL